MKAQKRANHKALRCRLCRCNWDSSLVLKAISRIPRGSGTVSTAKSR
jgi:hypothetical protein